jgi:hypothetical protein
MIQPEPYEIVHEYEEPIITHHYTETVRGGKTERDTVRATGLGQTLVGTTQEVAPLEARYAGQQRIPGPAVAGPVTTVAAPVTAYAAPAYAAAPVTTRTVPTTTVAAPVATRAVPTTTVAAPATRTVPTTTVAAPVATAARPAQWRGW